MSTIMCTRSSIPRESRSCTTRLRSAMWANSTAYGCVASKRIGTAPAALVEGTAGEGERRFGLPGQLEDLTADLAKGRWLFQVPRTREGRSPSPWAGGSVSCHLLRLGCNRQASRARLKPRHPGILTPQCAPDSCLANLVVDSKLAHCLASSVTFGNFPALTSVEYGLAAKYGALGFGSLDAFIAALADQLALELVKPAHHRGDQLPIRCRGYLAMDHPTL